MAARTDFVDRGPSDPETAFNTVYAADLNALGTEVNGKAPLASPAFTGTPTGITKTHVGLGSVDNTSDASVLASAAAAAASASKSADTVTDGTTNKAYTATEKTKLAAVEALADVTDAGNVGSAIHGATAKTAPVTNDEVALIDSAASNVLRRITYGDLSTAIVALITASAPSTLDTLQELATALGNDPNFAASMATALGLKAPLASPAFTGTPTGITKTHVGLGNVDNTSNATERAATATLAGKTLTNPTVTNYVETAQIKATVTTTKTLDPSTGTVIPLQLTASTACTVTMPTAAAGKSLFVPVFQAGTTGLGTVTFTGVKWPGGTAPTMTATANRMDQFAFWSDGTSWFGTVAQNFS